MTNLTISLEELFGDRKFVIGVVHLLPLPGSPMFDGNLDVVFERALEDARSLYEGGVDGIIVENFGDAPYQSIVNTPETIAFMTSITKDIVKSVDIPVGVNILRNSAIEAASVSMATGAKFIRVNAYVETVASDSGILYPAAPDLLRFLAKYKQTLKLGILADIHVKHGEVIGKRDIVETAMDALFRSHASAVIVTGSRTGTPPKEDELQRLVRNGIRDVIIGSGMNPNNIHLLEYAKGCIVGTYFKKDGITTNPVDTNRVKEFIAIIKRKFSQ